MMVEKTYLNNMGQLLKDLEHAASTLEGMGNHSNVTKHELNNLIKVLNNFNETIDPNFLSDKKLAPEGLNKTIEKALNALNIFQTSQPVTPGMQKNIDQAVVALFSTLSKEIKDFDKNLRNLKKYKIGRKVEKSQESKDADSDSNKGDR